MLSQPMARRALPSAQEAAAKGSPVAAGRVERTGSSADIGISTATNAHKAAATQILTLPIVFPPEAGSSLSDRKQHQPCQASKVAVSRRLSSIGEEAPPFASGRPRSGADGECPMPDGLARLLFVTGRSL
jgi:hypothetical protein